MPELPEVETSCRGIEPHINGRIITSVVVRDRRLRWPVPAGLDNKTRGQKVLSVSRRGKYILIELEPGHIIIHLGMSGSLRICETGSPAEKHDHVDICFDNTCLRLRDPRRFGCVLWHKGDPASHKLLQKLGPEPLSSDFSSDYLYQQSRKRSCSVKSFIMNSHVVVGVGNIYACESLFRAGINPKKAAGKISKQRYALLTEAIKHTLQAAIKQGGTTLRDFTSETGKPGYFAQQLNVYGKAGDNCMQCGNTIRQITQQNRSTFYCPSCQR